MHLTYCMSINSSPNVFICWDASRFRPLSFQPLTAPLVYMQTSRLVCVACHSQPVRPPTLYRLQCLPRVVVSTAAYHARVRGSVPGLGGLKETKMFLPHPRVKVSIVGSLRDREVACSASDRQGSNFESCVWRTVSSQSSHHPQEVLLAQFSLYVHKGGLKPDSFIYNAYPLGPLSQIRPRAKAVFTESMLASSYTSL